jgi:D-alanyl-D-alanine carboxypeptidase
MEHTHFSNAHGLFADPTHVTTPRDAATALRAALKNPFFAEVFSLRSYTVPATRRHGARNYKTSLALFDPEDPAYCEGLTGAKGGFTDEAGRCLASFVSRGGVSYCCVLMGANLDASRHYPNRNMTVSETQTLIDYVYTHFDLRTLYRKGELVTTLPIVDSEQTAAIAAGEEIRALIRVTSEPDLRLELPENLVAEEMENGKAVGTLTLVFDENTVAACPLLIRYGGEKIHVMSSFEKGWNRFTGAVSGLFRTDKVFVILLILLLVVIGVCIPAVKITQHLHKKFSRPPKH